MIIYVSSPMAKGDISENIRQACFAGDEILRRGHIPIIPHLTFLWHLISPKPWIEWLQIDFALLSVCDALLRLDGESEGADLEVAEAERLCIFIYHSLQEVPYA